MVEEAALIVIAEEPLYVVPELNVMLAPAVKLNRLEPKDTPDIVLFAKAIVPEVVIVPPDKPVPAVMLVTVP